MISLTKIYNFILLLSLILFNLESHAQNYQDNYGIFKILNKINSRVKEAKISPLKNYDIGNLTIQLETCHIPNNGIDMGFINVINKKDNKDNYSGWLFKNNYKIGGFENKFYDIFLVKCIYGKIDE